MIISVYHPEYKRKRKRLSQSGKHNGAYYYAKEIEQNIIPNVVTDRNWVLVNVPPYGCDHAIVFIHNNLHPQNYEWLKKYDDLILVCGVPETVDKVKHLGKAIYLPLSIDVEHVKQFKLPKSERKGTAYAGRTTKKEECELPEGIDCLEGMKRTDLLQAMAKREEIYAVGRTAIEAKCLGCRLKAFDERYPKVSKWKVLDNKEAAKILQKKLIEIDGSIIVDHEQELYKKARRRIGKNKYNGAYYYSKEIVDNIIPNVQTDRNWVTIKAGEIGADHSICFVHNNLTFEETYDYMKQYNDVVYIVGLPDMIDRASKFGETIYLPLSVDVEYVKQFARKKTKKTAFVGRPEIRPRIKRDYNVELPDDIDFIEGLPREELLAAMAEYEEVYAIGRTAIEAKILGCKILPYHPRLPDVSVWKVVDNKEAAKILQEKLNKIDGCGNIDTEGETQ